MKTGLTHIIFVVDRSGSMRNIATDMIGGYNQYISKQKEVPGECFVSFYQFDDIFETVFERVELSKVAELTDKTYTPRGFTALFDAMGRTIKSYGEHLASLPEEERPERILFITITDGLNNRSKEYTLAQVADMVKHQTEVYKWDFAFLGSNIDAWDAGSSLGIGAANTLQFANSKGSVSSAFDSLGHNSTLYRSATVKSAYSFSDADKAAQDQFLDGDLKSKNKKQQSPKSATK